MRIRVGVTGRRVLPPGMEQLLAREFEPAIRSALDAPSRAAFDRGGAAYTVVTPLAEGADRLVAREVLKRPLSEMRVVLPMLQEEYLQTFDTDAARAEFLDMLAGHEIVPMRTEPLPVEGRQQALEAAYWDSGVYVVENCDILFVLWDGLPSKGRGGTSYVVELARNSGRALVILWTADGTETVRHECPIPVTLAVTSSPR